MSKKRKVAYLPVKVAEDMETFAESYTSESSYIAEAVKEKNAKEKKKSEGGK